MKRGMLIAWVLLFVANLALLCAVLWTGRMNWAVPAMGLLSPVLILLRARFPTWTARHKAPLTVVMLLLAIALLAAWARQIGSAKAARLPACPSRTVPSGTKPLPDTLAT